jgi:hypothetical protein
LLTATRMTEHPKLPQGWELASLGNHAADTGELALRGAAANSSDIVERISRG